MCVAMVIIHTKTLEKKAVDDVISTESLQLVRQQRFTLDSSCIVYSLIGVWFGQYLLQKNLNIEKIIFKDVQMKFLAMHINNQSLGFYIFTVGNIFIEHDLNI